MRIDVSGERRERPIRHPDRDRRHVLEGVRHGEQENVHSYLAKTSLIGVIRMLLAGTFSLSAPITLSSSRSACGFSPSYSIGENASAASACFNAGASFATITIERRSAERCLLIAALTSSLVSCPSAVRMYPVNSPMPYQRESRAYPSCSSWRAVIT